MVRKVKTKMKGGDWNEDLMKKGLRHLVVGQISILFYWNEDLMKKGLRRCNFEPSAQQ